MLKLIIMKNNFAISILTITLITAAVSKDCDKCIHKEKCTQFGNLSQEAQDSFLKKHPCSPTDYKDDHSVFGFDSVAKGDYVCCSDSLWGTSANDDTVTSDATPTQTPQVSNRIANYGDNFGNYDDNDGSGITYRNNPRDNNPWGSGSQNDNNQDYNNGYNSNEGNPSYGYNDPNAQSPPKNYFNQNNNPYVTPSPFFPIQGAGNNGDFNQGVQCPVTSSPPAPETGCCGREATDADRIIGHQPRQNPPRHSYRYNNWRPHARTSPEPSWPAWLSKLPDLGSDLNRISRSTDAKVNISIGTRIAGGRETKFTQFPWTVLLKVTFDYGDKRQAFNCGGSLISSRYVLTAGHCVYDKGGTVIDIDVYLAEYDKRTFPKDCKYVPGEGEKCIENIVMKADDFVLHPKYEDRQLKNDIALIKLRGNAPYTDYIRPICLPSIDIDTPTFSNLRLAVAGWGRNGRYRSDIKQSTIVNLVPHAKCSKFYPGLTRESLCAAGYTGEDTCKGDSGGPLMTMYGGKYEVVGVVSGKRADSPCGTSVPSLYTNVYHYLDWIRNNVN